MVDKLQDLTISVSRMCVFDAALIDNVQRL